MNQEPRGGENAGRQNSEQLRFGRDGDSFFVQYVSAVTVQGSFASRQLSATRIEGARKEPGVTEGRTRVATLPVQHAPGQTRVRRDMDGQVLLKLKWRWLEPPVLIRCVLTVFWLEDSLACAPTRFSNPLA